MESVCIYRSSVLVHVLSVGRSTLKTYRLEFHVLLPTISVVFIQGFKACQNVQNERTFSVMLRNANGHRNEIA